MILLMLMRHLPLMTITSISQWIMVFGQVWNSLLHGSYFMTQTRNTMIVFHYTQVCLPINFKEYDI